MISFSQFRQTEIQVAESDARYFLGGFLWSRAPV